ncbi:restriction endonuclease subunit S [Chryseobacterium sp. SG20098]|uniref:restriction endonuclease subunit S n=1 Tax=Chryseobacterium sp. SG20098 TaxID=3074145 RepID=UPI002882DEF1|nr:restriction endonuclease subunit S [Chryseobacterium sp. SG20098]WNI35933.1 restriction endonuclease subunit S [Chryseobacterium sp. SG20098]
MKTNLHSVFSDKISGEWGDDDPMGEGVSIIRTANFNNDGSIDFSTLVTRLVQKDAKDDKGKIIKFADGTSKKEVDSKKIENKKLLNEDIIIEKSGGGIGTPVGRVAFFKNPDDKIYLSNNFTQTLRVNKSIAAPKYIFYYLKYLYKRGNVLKYQNQTTGLFNLKIEKYFQEEIFLPEHSKQYAIVTQLDTIRELINKRIETIELLNKLMESIYFEMFGDPIVNPHHHPRVKLSSKKFKITSGITPSRKKDVYFEGEIPWVKSTDINKEIIYSTEEKISQVALEKTTAKIYPKGSVLLAMYGQGSTRGKVALLGVEASANQACAVINGIGYSNTFLFFTLKCSYQYLRSISKGGNRDNLSLTEIKKISIISPPLKSQNEFENKFNYLQGLKKSLELSLDTLQNLFQAVLQNAFNSDAEVDEQSIFKDLIKRLEVADLRGNVKRLQYLLELFDGNKFDNDDDYFETKNKLFDLILENEIEQKLVNDKIILQVK